MMSINTPYNTFHYLDDAHKQSIIQARTALNQTLSLEKQDILSRFILKDIFDEWYWLMDLMLNKKVWYISFSSISNGVIDITKYGIEPEYQWYGLSTLLLWLFCTKWAAKIGKINNLNIIWINIKTALLRTEITQSSFKYFENNNWVIANPCMDTIVNSIHQKMQTPHEAILTATSHIHIWRFAL